MAKAAAVKKNEPGKAAVGKTLALGVMATWAVLFADNEKRNGPKRTDEQITAFLNKEFPGRNSAVFGRVQSVRSAYNRGILTKGEIPKTPSVRWGKDGVRETVKRGRPSPKETPAPKAKLTIKKKAA